MQFPRNPDNSLNFKAFSALTPELQKEAFSDLNKNGTPDDKQAFKDWKAEVIRRKAELAQMEARLQELSLRKAELTDKLAQEIRPHVEALVKGMVSSSATPLIKPSSSQTQSTPCAKLKA